jgi:hypothetical protein
MQIYDSIVKLIKGLDPSILAVDDFLNAGFDACYTLNQKVVISTPNSPTDVAKKHQPWLKGLWYYPVSVIHPSLVPKPELTFSSSDQDQ